MAYIDDWNGVSPDEQKRLKEICAVCGAFRYMHGDVSEVKTYGFRSLQYTAGKCTHCACTDFVVDPPITKDEVMDLTERLKPENIHLADIGIAGVACMATITRTTGLGNVVVSCRLTGGHQGQHET